MSFTKLSLLLVNYKTESYVLKLLDALSKQTLANTNFEIIIINNCQNSDLSLLISDCHFDKLLTIKIYENPKNIGFGQAMNQAFLYAQGEHILMINPDVNLLCDEYLEELLKFAQKYPNYGVISTQILNNQGQDVSTYHEYEFGQRLGFEEGDICWFEGSLLLIRSCIFEMMGGFDKDFFMYCEDVDLCLRIKQAGYGLIKNNALKIHHVGGGSQIQHTLDYYKRRVSSQLIFAQKHYDHALFKNIVESMYKKSKKRMWLYQISCLMFKKHRRHLLKNKAMYLLSRAYLK